MVEIPGLDTEAFFNFAIDTHDTPAVFKIAEGHLKAPRRSEMIQWVNKAMNENEEFMALYKERYNPRFPTDDELQACPEGSLGRELGNHLRANDIKLDFAGIDTSVFYQKDETPFAYFGTRGVRTHDVYHVVLNLSTSPLDEFRLLSFTLAQYASPYHMSLISAAYLRTAFYEPENIPEFLDSMARYYRLGKSAKFFPGFPFESYWATPISEVRRMLNVEIA